MNDWALGVLKLLGTQQNMLDQVLPQLAALEEKIQFLQNRIDDPISVDGNVSG